MGRLSARTLALGFTLVELAVTIALMVTLITLAGPTLGDVVARHRLRAAAEALAADLHEARFAAARQGRPVHVTFSGGPQACWAIADRPDCDCRVPQTCRIKAVALADHPGATLSATRTASFAADGTGRGSAELHSPSGHVLRVDVGPTGRPLLCVSGGVHQPGVERCP
jgi:Tfp pilus assembly protein FimT